MKLHFLLLLFATAFAPAQDAAPADPSPEEASATDAPAQNAPAYRLRVDDEIRLTVLGHPTLLRTEKITASGEVSFPLIKSVRLIGLTLREAEDLVAAKYDADFLVNPSVSINLIQAADNVIEVAGAVVNTGEQNFTAGKTLDLASALENAGGLAAQADPLRIELKRGGETSTFQYGEITAPGAAQILLEHGDRVTVAVSRFANKTVTIFGEVNAPGSYEFPIAGKLSLDLLLAKSQGLTEAADSSRISVKRKEQILRGVLGAQQLLEPGDLVTVPPSLFESKFVTVTGTVGRPGKVPFDLDGKFTLLEAINKAGGFTPLSNKERVRVSRNINGKAEVIYPLNCEKMEQGMEPDRALMPGDLIHIKRRIF